MTYALIQNVNEGDAPCPCAHVEKVVFELDKRYEGTILQVLVSPAVLVITDNFKVQLTASCASALSHERIELSLIKDATANIVHDMGKGDNVRYINYVLVAMCSYARGRTITSIKVTWRCRGCSSEVTPCSRIVSCRSTSTRWSTAGS